jgi:hypothetical protein
MPIKNIPAFKERPDELSHLTMSLPVSSREDFVTWGT